MLIVCTLIPEVIMNATQNVSTKLEADAVPAEASTQQKLRILFASHTYVVGINQGKLAAIANTRFTQIGLLAPRLWRAKSWGQIFNLEQNYAEISYYPAKVFLNGRTGGYVYALGSILSALRHFAPDILQVEEEVFSLSTFQVAIAARLTKTPLVVFGWENLEKSLPRPRRWLRKFVLDTAKLIIAGNQDGADLLRQWGYTGTITVMPQMGVDAALFKATPRSLPTCRPFRIGFMGRLVQEKGIDLIFSAAHQLKESGHSFEIILCGSGQDESQLRELADQQEIAQYVVWRGKVSHAEVPIEMAQFDVLVLPSKTTLTWKEQFGHVLIEAMSMGVPVIGSSSGEIPYVIDRPDLIFTENDATGLANILKRMTSDATWYAAASQYGIDRVQSRYTHERIAEQLIADWASLLKTNSF